MQRSERFEGGGAPFEGDRTLWVRSIPEGAHLSAAVLTLTPVAAPGAPLFQESIAFAGDVGTFGATQSRNDAGLLHWTELDFHQRRTVTRIQGGALTGAEVQVDLGGLYVQLNPVGAPKGPDDATALTLGTDGAIPGLTANKVKLTHSHALPVNEVTLRSAPSNVAVRAGTQPTLFSRPGELVTPVTTPDVAVALQEALSTADVDGGFYQLPLVIHSDTVCRLDVELSVEFTVAQPALPGGLTETTLSYDFAGATATPAVTLAVPPGGRLVPAAARARALGAFQESRVGYGPVGPVIPAGALALTSGQSLAVPVTVPADLDATAVDLLLAASTPTARLQLDVVADTDGKPWNQPLLARPAEIGIERGDDPAPRWTSVALAQPFTFRAGVRYWLTLQVESGEAAWSVRAATVAPATQQSRDGGLSWRAAVAPGVASTDALLRLRIVPATFTMPIQLEVGDGASATRVSLDRFAPLGRVEIDLNAPEVIDGVNAAISAAAAASCPTGEHVRNGDFALWTRTADQPTGSQPLDAGFRSRRVAVAHDCVAFVAGGDEDPAAAPLVHVQMAAVDVFADRVEAPTPPLAAGRALSGLAADPAGRYGYALLDGNAVLTLDRETLRTASATLLRDGATALLATPDGSALYVAATDVVDDNEVHSVAAVPVDGVRAGGTSLWGAEAVLDAPPIDMAAPDDGATLWVLCDDDGDSSLVSVDAASLAVTGSPIPLATGAVRIAVSAGGSMLAAVHAGSGMLTVIDPVTRATRQVDLAENNDDPQPSAVAVTADGGYAFVTLANLGVVALVDLTARRVLRRIQVGAAPADCAITPDGERVYVADDTFTEITIGALLPADWVVTAGVVRPWCVPPDGRVAVVGAAPRPFADPPPPTATAAIAQVLPVSGGCRYELTFAGLASAEGASAELHWLAAGCAEQRTDTLPLNVDRPRIQSGIVAAVSLEPHRLLVDAPAGAAQAELRITAPAGVIAVVDSVSLHATSSVLPNGDLSLFGDLLDGWQVAPPSPTGFSAAVAEGELVLRNAGGVVVTVAQQATVAAGQDYLLTVDAATQSGSPSVELAFGTGDPVSVPLVAGASRPLVRSVTAPAGAVSGEVRLVLPPGCELRLRRVSLDSVETTRVPVSFVAESPGELTMTNWQVAYDVDETPRVPPLPAGGLCRPGRPQPVPGEGGDVCYCPTCQGEHDMTDPQPTITAAGTPATTLTCTHCGAGVTLPGVSAGTAPSAGPVVVIRPPGVDVGVALRPAAGPLRAVPLDAVTGIGPATARRLNAIGIVAMADLAATPPDRLTALLQVTEAAARSWIGQARVLAAATA